MKKNNREVLEELNITPTYKEFDVRDEETTKFNLSITMLCMNSPDIKIKDLMSDEEVPFIVQIMLKRVEAVKMSEFITDLSIIYSLIFGIDNPGKAVLYITELMDFVDTYKRPITLDDLSMRIFPNGFYSDDTCLALIDKVLKPKKSKNSYIY